MAIGCYTVSRALHLQPGQAGKLALLFGTLNLYELLLVGLGSYLIRRGQSRDGRLLLLLELPFLGDATLLTAEFFAISPSAGAAAWVCAAALALVKLRLLVRGLGGDGAAALRPWATLTAGLALPGGFAALASEGWLSSPLAYGFWWLAALIAFLHVAGRGTHRRPQRESALTSHALERLPLASLLGHLAAATWTHEVGFGPAFLAPLLIAAAAVAMLCEPRWASRRARLALPLAAVLLSSLQGHALVIPGSVVAFSALRATLLAGGLLYLAGFWRERDPAFASGAALCLGAASLGHTPGAIAVSFGGLWRGLVERVRGVVPRDAVGWGITAIVASFVLLAAGAVRSLRGEPEARTRSHS